MKISVLSQAQGFYAWVAFMRAQLKATSQQRLDELAAQIMDQIAVSAPPPLPPHVVWCGAGWDGVGLDGVGWGGRRGVGRCGVEWVPLPLRTHPVCACNVYTLIFIFGARACTIRVLYPGLYVALMMI